MIAKTITYKDYDGMERTETHRFNLNESELTTMQLSEAGGLKERLQTMIDANDIPQVMRMFREILHLSYGEKSADGRRFMKSDEISRAFEETEAYNILFMELCTDAEKAGKFIEGVLPDSLKKAAAQKKGSIAALPNSESETE